MLDFTERGGRDNGGGILGFFATILFSLECLPQPATYSLSPSLTGHRFTRLALALPLLVECFRAVPLFIRRAASCDIIHIFSFFSRLSTISVCCNTIIPRPLLNFLLTGLLL